LRGARLRSGGWVVVGRWVERLDTTVRICLWTTDAITQFAGLGAVA
jgi:hypothetical protein